MSQKASSVVGQGEAEAQARAAPRAPSSYQAFLARLNHPESAGLLRSLRLFVRNALAATSLSVDSLAEATRVFYEQMEATIAQHPQWADCEPAELERAADGVEKFVMTRLHDRVFAAEGAEAAEDEQMATWLQRLRFLRVEHLAISPEFRSMQPWASAQQELCRIATYRTPRDKLVCVLNCCKRINSALSQASSGGHGADEFFPVLLYVTVQAAPAGLHASLQYISRFRHPSKLVSEAAYYLTHQQSALTFLSSVQPEQLCIESAEFERGLAESHAIIERQRSEAAAAKAAAAKAAAEAAAEMAAESAAAQAAEAEAEAPSTPAAAEASSEAMEEVEDGGLLRGYGARGAASAFFAKLMENSPGAPRHLFDSPSASQRAAAEAASPATPIVGELQPRAVSGRLGNLLEAVAPPLQPQMGPAHAAAPSSTAGTGAADGTGGGGGSGGGGRHWRGVFVGVQLNVKPPDSTGGKDGNGQHGTSVRVEFSLGTWAAMRRRQLELELGPPPSLRFLETRSVLELTVGDVSSLLKEYHWLSRALRETKSTRI